jgi:hypothetical protein
MCRPRPWLQRDDGSTASPCRTVRRRRDRRPGVRLPRLRRERRRATPGRRPPQPAAGPPGHDLLVRGRHDLDADRVALWGNSLGGAHVISVAADDPGIAAVVAQIPFNGFPRARDHSATASLRLLAAILWDALRGRLGLSPAYIPMIGKPSQVAVVSTTEAQRHLTTLAGEAGTAAGVRRHQRHRDARGDDQGAGRQGATRDAAPLSRHPFRLLHRSFGQGPGAGRSARVPP